jgi:hypothetical protein
MADRADLTPDQLLMLSQLGSLQSSGGTSGFGAGSGNNFFNTSVRGFNDPSASAGMANFGAGAQVADNARLQAMLNLGSVSQKYGDSSTLNPNIMAQVGPAQVMYGQQYNDGQRQSQQVGGGYNFGPASVNVNRSFSDAGPSATNYNLNVPTDYGNLSAGMIRGKGMPTAYQGAVQIPGLLGGDASIVGEYMPSQKSGAVYGRYSRKF